MALTVRMIHRIGTRVARLTAPATRGPGALRGLVVGGLAAAGAFAAIAASHGLSSFDEPWNDFEIPIELTIWLGAPAGLVGGWLLAPAASKPHRARGVVGTVLASGVAAALVGVVLFALIEAPFAVVSYGPAGLLVVPFLVVAGLFLAVFELPITLAAAAVWVAWMRPRASEESPRRSGLM